MNVITHEASERFSRVLGEAVVRMWGHLPHDLQDQLFREAVASREVSIKPQLAMFLHERHPRTSAAKRLQAIHEPDSLGG
jgi:hypothetical protein